MLALHIGAGSHSRTLDRKYRRLLLRALEHPLEGAARRVEHSALTNSGYGATLDMHGAVSCDATVVEASGRVERALSLVAVRDAACPTEACLAAMRQMEQEWDGGREQLGLLRPAMVVAPAPDEAKAAALVLPAARALYAKYRAWLAGAGGASDIGAGASDIGAAGAADIGAAGAWDTVGYIEVGAHTRVAASLGGMWLRPRGRVSCAGVLGAGAAHAARGAVEVSCVCSGNGDDIVRMGLAAHVCDELVRALQDGACPALAPLLVATVKRRAAGVSLGALHNGRPVCYVGVLVVVRVQGALLLVFCHSTESFYFGFRAPRARVVLSRLRAVGTFVSGEYILLDAAHGAP